MGQIYRLTDDQDDLLSEAEKAFDLSARRQSIGWSKEEKIEEVAPTGGYLGFFSGLIRRAEGEKPIG